MHPNELQEYHRIRKAEIFDSLPHITYDHNHPSMTATNHYHFILMHGVSVVAICHVEMLADNIALAAASKHQRQGYGTYLLQAMERWLRHQNKNKILLHAEKRAVEFYRYLGYSDMPFDDLGINQKNIDLGKIL